MTRYRNHTTSFQHIEHRNSTKLSKLNTSRLLKKITLTTSFHGASFHQDHLTAAQAKNANSVSKNNYSSSTNPNYHQSINIMNLCTHAATEI